ncbi:unnamed protein product [Lactuca saligna]|uniref:Uncharacterized protein n=1 Tax=Lactuca saligna TaxID=75948 RepID=A0AA35UYS4_LACSI|nr:unnamed protein product [Lactuca saligna]
MKLIRLSSCYVWPNSNFRVEVGLTIIDTIIGFDMDEGWIRIVFCVQDKSGSSSFVLFERHVKDLIHRGNQWLMEKIAKVCMFNLQKNYRAYTVQKLTNDERVLVEFFKRSPNLEHHIINDNATSINKPNKENTDVVHHDNIDVVDLEALTPSSSMGKRHIQIDANTNSLEWSSSKTGVVPSTLKIPKLKKLD